MFELYSIGITGAERVKVSLALPSGWDVAPAAPVADLYRLGYAITPGGTRVVYEIEQRVGGTLVDKQLYSVAIAGPGTAGVRLDNAPSDALPNGHLISPDSARVVYVLRHDDGNLSTRSVPIAGPASASVQISSPSSTGDQFRISRDGARVAWRLGNELYSTPIQGGASVRVNGIETSVSAPLINASSGRVVYRAVASGLSDRDVFSVPLSGSGMRFNLTSQLVAPAINSLLLTGDGLRAIYSAQVSGGGHHLYSSRLVP